MKYVEMIKNVILILLIVLSVSLTFSIWTFTPSLDPIKNTPVVDISIAEQKRVEDIVKPYKVVYTFDNRYTGTSDGVELDKLMDTMRNWEISELKLENNQMNSARINEVMNKPNRYTMFFQSDVPFPVYDSIMPFSSSNVPEAGFDRLVVDWSSMNGGKLNAYFISTKSNWMYSAKLSQVNSSELDSRIITNALKYTDYKQIVRDGQLSMFVPSTPVDSIRYTYYLKEISPERFKNALFNNPNLVRRSTVGSYSEEYSDDTALMNVDLLDRTLSFVNPSTAPTMPILPSDLLYNSLDFVNEHGGWTDDFHYVGMRPDSQYVEYQIFLMGRPVFSNVANATKIGTYWGNNRIYQYIRPYYTLDVSFPSETVSSKLPSGEETVEAIRQTQDIDFSKVEEVILGFYLTRDERQRLLILEPSWFYLSNGTWTRFAPNDKESGGVTFGLE